MDENRRKKGTTAKQLWTNAEKSKNEFKKKKGVQNQRTVERGSDKKVKGKQKSSGRQGRTNGGQRQKNIRGGGGLMDKGEKMEDK